MPEILPIDSYRIDLPANWKSVPVTEEGLKQALAPRAEKWEALDAPNRRRVEVFSRRLHRDLSSTNTSFLAIFAEVVPDEVSNSTGAAPVGSTPKNAGLSVLLAGCSISLLTRTELGSPLELTPSVLLRSMSATDGPEQELITNLDPPSLVTLPAGEAVRLVRLMRQQSIHGIDQVFVQSYLLPVAPDWETVSVLQFVSPCVEDASLFSELFKGLAESFVVYRQGDPTEDL
jgi:hypothetical protein